MKPSPQEKKAIQIVKTLRAHEHTAYFAGGCVRDLVMKRSPKDYDIATSATPDEVAQLFTKCVPVGKQFGVMLVVEGLHRFEVSTFRKEGPYRDGRHPDRVSFTTATEDAKRRDFTVNGLFYDPIKRSMIDYVDGVKDIRAKTIRTIGKPEDRFEEDRLRLLRAVRFAANLNFEIEPETWGAVKQLAGRIHSVSQERIRDELVKMFTRLHADRALTLLLESGLLKEILPEVEAMQGVQQHPEFHPEGDVFIHTRMLMGQLKNASPALAFGALLHDVGKPKTFSDEGGKIHFYEHARIGGEMAREILKRLRFSNEEIEDVVSCVEHHMTFADVKKMRVGKLKRFVVRKTFPTELALHRIDCLASHGKLDLYRFLKRKVREFKQEELKPKPIVNGYDLIELGIAEGPVRRTILEEVYSLQLEGRLSSREEARAWIKKNFLRGAARKERGRSKR